jgi:tetratricopeptide (TPR) repeat protein
MEWKNYLGGAGREYQIESGSLGWRADFDREAGSKADAPFLVAFPFFSEAKETIKLPHGGMGFFVDATDTDRTAAGIAFKRSTKVSGDTLTMTASAKAVVPEFPATSAVQAKADLRALADVAVYLHAPAFGLSPNITMQLPDKTGALIETCRSKALSGKNQSALADCQAALKLEPDSDDAKLARGFVYLRTGHFEAAVVDYHDVLRRRPNSPTAIFGLGQAELKSGAAGSGQAEMAAARDKNPKIDTEFYAGLPPSKGIATTGPQPETPDDFINQGRMLVSGRVYDLAIASFNTALKLDPKSAAAYANRGMAYFGKGSLDQASADFERSLQLNSTEITALKGRGYLAARKGDNATAITILTHVLDIEPDDTQVRASRASILADDHQYDFALKEVDALIGKAPDDPWWLNNRCYYRAMSGKDLNDALTDCNASLKLKDLPATHDSRGLVNLRLGKFDDAVADYDWALSREPKMASSLFGRGIAKIRRGATSEGQADIVAALAIDPKVQKEFAGYGVKP